MQRHISVNLQWHASEREKKKGRGEVVTRQLLRYETQCWRWKAFRRAIWICSWMTNCAEFKAEQNVCPNLFGKPLPRFQPILCELRLLKFSFRNSPHKSSHEYDYWHEGKASGIRQNIWGDASSLGNGNFPPYLILTAEAIVSLLLAQEGSNFSPEKKNVVVFLPYCDL